MHMYTAVPGQQQSCQIGKKKKYAFLTKLTLLIMFLFTTALWMLVPDFIVKPGYHFENDCHF